MSNKSFSIEVKGLQKVQKLFSELQQKTGDLTPVMRSIGNYIKNITELSFEEQKSPFGKKWTPSKSASKEGRLTLVKSGRLSNSITYSATKDSVTVGTNIVYAAIHQFGGKAGKNKAINLPARPFLPIHTNAQMPTDVIENIVEIIQDYLE